MKTQSQKILKEAWRSARLRGVFVHFQSAVNLPLTYAAGKVLLDGLRAREIKNDFLLHIPNAGENINLSDRSKWNLEGDSPKTVEPLPADKALNFNGYGGDFSQAAIEHFKNARALILAGIYNEACLKGAIEGILRHTSADVFAAYDATNDEKSPSSFRKTLVRPPYRTENGITLSKKERERLHIASTTQILASLDLFGNDLA